MKKINFLILSFFVLALTLETGCRRRAPALQPLELQSIQSREYDASKNVVYASVISVFLDLGYQLKSSDKDTGLITAESAATSSASSKAWLGISKVSQTSASAFIERIGKTTKVRLSFVTSLKTSTGSGRSDRIDTPITNVKVYQNAFERIENAIFIRSSN